MEPILVNSGEQKESLLVSAAGRLAGLLGDDLPDVGDPLDYLRAYYRHFPPDDLTAIGPDRAAAVAAEHARLGARRPQGKPLVCVRVPTEPDDDHVAFDPDRAVVDIVTDDMPFLVDSVTMGLNRNNLEIGLMVHPQLRVSRDVTGALRKVLGPVEDGYAASDEINESWTHIEVSKPSGDLSKQKLESQLRAVLDDVRVAVEDYDRMRTAAVQLADRLAAEGRDESAAYGDVDDREVEALLRWLVDGHFTFLGYREYDLIEGSAGMALRAVPGTGLGILRHDEAGADALATLPPEVSAKAKEPVRLVLTKANSRSTVHRPYYLDYVALKRFDDSGEVVGEYRFLGLYTHVAYSESIRHIPVLRRKLTERARGRGHSPRQPRRQGPGGDPRDVPAGGAVPDLGGRAHPDRAGRAAARRAQADQAVPAPGPVRPVHDLPDLPAAGPVEYEGAPAHPGNPDQGTERCLRGLLRHDQRVRAGPAAGGGPRQSAAGRCPTWTRPSSSARSRRPSGPGTTTCTRKRCASSARGKAARWPPRSPT